MLRQVLPALVCLLLAVPAAQGQEWANKMFTTTNHDFGIVARGAKAQFRFQVKNIYEEDAHITSVKSSCGCTVPTLTKNDLKTFEAAEVVADFNTRDFLGQKSATLTVNFDKPFPAEVQLHINGFIRSDVVVQPGAVDLGTVDFGQTVEKRLQVTYAGRDDWKILDVKTTEPFFEVELTELSRGGGKVAYELLVRMTKDAPPGYIKDQLILVTSDAKAREFPVDMEGRVASKITVSPERLFIGTVQPGQTVSKKVVVRGKEPFRILDFKCPDKAFKIEPSNESKTVHLVQVVFTAGEDPGRVTRKISILTDQDDHVVQAFTADALVVKGNGSPTAAPPEPDDADSR